MGGGGRGGAMAGFRPGKTQTGLLSCRDLLESRNFAFSKSRYCTTRGVRKLFRQSLFCQKD